MSAEPKESHNKLSEMAIKAVKSIQSFGEVSSAMKPVATDELGANKSLQQLASEVPLDAGEKKEGSHNAVSEFALKAVKSFQSYGEVSSAMKPVASDSLGANKSLHQVAEEQDAKDAAKKAEKKEKKGFFAKLKAFFD